MMNLNSLCPLQAERLGTFPNYMTQSNGSFHARTDVALAVYVRGLTSVPHCKNLAVKMSEKGKKRAYETFTIISDIEKGMTQADICTTLKLKKSTVSNIWKNRDKINNCNWKINDKKKKMRSSTHPQVDDLLFQWFLQTRANNFPRGWIDLKKGNIVFGKVCGESASVDRNVTDDWISKVWPAISKDYSFDGAFNADETGIFYLMMPDKTYKIKGETYAGGKMSKG
ncbi:hypothetical protein QE152_g98 [Popillia japonica]|uniref:Transposase n=1 Tax=Popillia japonica TaxID=7064 RepID=A0AAW1NDH2_POPJA